MASEPEARISLVVPLQDEASTVDALLLSIERQSRPPDEVVLVDAGSIDDTAARARARPLKLPLKFVCPGRVYPGVARNAGVGSSTGEWIAFTDGGIVLDPDWLKELARAAGPDVEAVFGGVDPVCDSLFRECAAVAYVLPRDRHGGRGRFVASSLIRRATLMAVGGFPAYRAAEDLILMDRLDAAGARCARAPKAVCHWQIAGDLRSTFSRFASYSYHNLCAGWARHWHLGIARLYVLLSLAILFAVVLGVGIYAVLAVPAFFVARAAKAAWQKRTSFSFPTLRPTRVLGAAGVLLVVDVATAVGFGRWLRERVRS